MVKLKGFISYAHADHAYFELIKDGLRKHGKHSKLIDSELWTDEEILVGTLWHESIQEQIKGCDFAVFLVSSNFLASDYIEAHEFSSFLKRQDDEGVLFFPLLINPCNFSYWEQLAARQFFLPKGKDYGMPELRDCLTFGDLVQYNLRTGDVLPNTNRERYLKEVVEKIEGALLHYKNKKESQKALLGLHNFRVRHVSDIQPIHLLETRSKTSQGFNPYYLNRPYLDDRLSTNFDTKRHTIITGKPLSGKTRAILELCENFKHRNILLLFPEIKKFDISIINIPKSDAELIIIFDDFEKYLYLENLDAALEKLMIRDDVWVVATCRNEYLSDVRFVLDDEFHNFDCVEIHQLDVEEDNALRLSIPNRPNSKSDGTPGAYFLPVNAMRRHFESLAEESLEREIFHAAKSLKVWGNVEYDASFKKNKIQEYCIKRLKEFYLSTRTIAPFEWKKSFQNLTIKDLIVDMGDSIAIEEIYLEKFVNESVENLLIEGVHYFPSYSNFNYFFLKSNNRNLETIFRFIDLLKNEDVPLDENIFKTILSKAPDWPYAAKVLTRMKDEGFVLNSKIYNIILTQKNNLTSAEKIYKEMEEEGISPDINTYNILLSRSSNWDDIEGVLNRMREEDLAISEKTYSLILRACNTKECLDKVFDRMKLEGIKFSRKTFKSILSKSNNSDYVESALLKMKEAGLLPYKGLYKILLKRAPDWNYVEKVLHNMRGENIKLDLITYKILLKKTSNWNQIENLINEIRESGSSMDEKLYRIIAGKTTTWPHVELVLENMKLDQIDPDRFIYYSIITKSNNINIVATLLREMDAKGIKVQEEIFLHLLNQAKNWEFAKGIIQVMDEFELYLKEVDFNNLINKASSLDIAEQYFSLMQEKGIIPGEITYNSLINKALLWADMEGYLNKMKSIGLYPNEPTFNAMILKAPDLDKAFWIIGETQKHGYTIRIPNVHLIKVAGLERNSQINEESEREFFEKYFEIIKIQNDNIIRIFAEACSVPGHKERLVECLKEKNWWYWKIKADLAIAYDSEKCFSLLEKAIAEVPIRYMAHVNAIWVRNVVFNNISDLFDEAIIRCKSSIMDQPKGKLSYTAKLMIWIYLNKSMEPEPVRKVKNEIMDQLEISNTQINNFLEQELWKSFPIIPHWVNLIHIIF